MNIDGLFHRFTFYILYIYIHGKYGGLFAPFYLRRRFGWIVVLRSDSVPSRHGCRSRVAPPLLPSNCNLGPSNIELSFGPKQLVVSIQAGHQLASQDFGVGAWLLVVGVTRFSSRVGLGWNLPLLLFLVHHASYPAKHFHLEVTDGHVVWGFALARIFGAKLTGNHTVKGFTRSEHLVDSSKASFSQFINFSKKNCCGSDDRRVQQH